MPSRVEIKVDWLEAGKMDKHGDLSDLSDKGADPGGETRQCRQNRSASSPASATSLE